MAYEINLGRVKGADGRQGMDGNGFFAMDATPWSTAQLLVAIPEIKVGDFIINTHDTNRNWGGFTVSPGTVVRVLELSQDTALQWRHERRGAVRGIQGIVGPAPTHQWSGTSVRFQHPGGGWGEWINLAVPTQGGGDGKTAINTLELKLQHPHAEIEFHMDLVFVWVWKQFFGDPAMAIDTLSSLTFEEKVFSIVHEGVMMLHTMGLPHELIMSYIPQDIEIEPTQQVYNFVLPFVDLIFNQFRKVQFGTRINTPSYFNLGSIDGNFRIVGDQWSTLDLGQISADSMISFIRPTARPDLSSLWNCCHDLLNGPLYAPDLEFIYNNFGSELIIKGRVLDVRDRMFYDINIVCGRIRRWSSYIQLEPSSRGIVIHHESLYNQFHNTH